jgi:hypothetical protein
MQLNSLIAEEILGSQGLCSVQLFRPLFIYLLYDISCLLYSHRKPSPFFSSCTISHHHLLTNLSYIYHYVDAIFYNRIGKKIRN